MDFTELDDVITNTPGSPLLKVFFEELKDNLDLSALTEYVDNAAATTAGLTVGSLYRTGDFLKVVHL